MAKIPAIIVDLDGTLCNVDHRLHFLKQEKKDWSQFHLNCSKDKIELWCFSLIECMKNSGHAIVLLTGRDENYREITEAWLSKHQVSWDLLVMRHSKDFRPDYEVKWELYKNVIEERFLINFIVEDRLSVVNMWREKGFRCLQCATGDF